MRLAYDGQSAQNLEMIGGVGPTDARVSDPNAIPLLSATRPTHQELRPRPGLIEDRTDRRTSPDRDDPVDIIAARQRRASQAEVVDGVYAMPTNSRLYCWIDLDVGLRAGSVQIRAHRHSHEQLEQDRARKKYVDAQ